jgi:hypothetical protein
MGSYALDTICNICHIVRLSWTVEIGDEFKPEFFSLHEGVRTEILALARLLQQFGPQLGRPRVDTLKGSRHANMKELRFSAANGEWTGGSEKRFYRKCSVKPTTVSTPMWPGWKGKGDNDAQQRRRHN